LPGLGRVRRDRETNRGAAARARVELGGPCPAPNGVSGPARNPGMVAGELERGSYAFCSAAARRCRAPTVSRSRAAPSAQAPPTHQWHTRCGSPRLSKCPVRAQHARPQSSLGEGDRHVAQGVASALVAKHSPGVGDWCDRDVAEAIASRARATQSKRSSDCPATPCVAGRSTAPTWWANH
jgi:hypothetical protein